MLLLKWLKMVFKDPHAEQAMLTDETKQELVELIKSTEKVDTILLFGSEATGTAGHDSDIDLLVVLDDMTMPGSFRERSANYLLISRAIRNIEKRHPIDLLVYTRPEFEKLKASNSLFVRRILREGISLSSSPSRPIGSGLRKQTLKPLMPFSTT